MNEDVLFLFAHQDDEVGISTRIVYEAGCGNRVWCAYLTDGGLAVPPEVRDAESTRALRRLGVEADRIAFLADAGGRIPDGKLVDSLSRARAMVTGWIRETKVRFSRMFAPDWEGGHHDHDAVHLLALVAARDFEIASVYGFSLYNAHRRRPGWFRVASLVPASGVIHRRRLRLREAIAAIVMIAGYPSQWRTWLGIAPGFAVRILLRREERFRTADPSRVAHRPHVGPLLYETRFRRSAVTVLDASAELRSAILADAPGAFMPGGEDAPRQ